MKILTLEIENYRQYRGKQKIEFSADDSKNFTIFVGANGAGKTNLLNAITWCLYDREEHLARTPREMMMNIVNEQVLNALPVGGKATARVRISLGDNTPRQVFERSVTAKKSGAEGEYAMTEEPLHAWFLLNKSWEESKQPVHTVNGLLPQGIKDFFLFDGEKLDRFFQAGNEEEVKRAILSVSQIDLLDRAMDHLDEKLTQIRRDAKGISPKANLLLADLQDTRELLEKVKVELEDLRKQKTETAKNLGEIENRLRESNVPLVQTLHRQRDELMKNMDQTVERSARMREQILNHLVKIGPLIYAKNALNSTLELVDSKFRSGELPPQIRDTFLHSLLNRGSCICGTDISTDGRERHSLENLLKVAKFSELENSVTQGKYVIEQLIGSVTSFSEPVERLEKDLLAENDQYERGGILLKEINAKLRGINVEEIQLFENQRVELRNALDDLIKDVSFREINQKNLESKMQSLSTEHRHELEKERKHGDLLAKIDLCDKGIQLLKSVKEEVVGEVRKTIETKTKEYFLSLIWKRETYVDVRIDSNFRVSVINRLGSESIGSLSAGERQVLALSFMAALTKVSGFKAPVVIDTPLGRISGEPKDNIAASLPEYLKDTQVTMLMTDQEYTPSVRQKLSLRVGKEWALEFDESNFETKVKPVIA